MTGIRQENTQEGGWALAVTTAPALKSPLCEELRELTDARISERPFGASLRATPKVAYELLCSSLLAGHFYVELLRGLARDADALYRLVQRVDWPAQFAVDVGLSVSFSGGNAAIRNTQFGMQRVKDAIVDQFVARRGRRPSVDTVSPGMRVHVHLAGTDLATVSVELSAGSLHQRGYRDRSAEAPLRENLAAGVLWRARWPRMAEAGLPLLDPMCGSGTLLIEAALMRRGLPESMRRRRIGSPGWSGHDQGGLEDAVMRSGTIPELPILVGLDVDPQAVALARENARAAGLEDLIHFEVRDAQTPGRPDCLAGQDHGLLVTNLPYGRRIGDSASLPELFRRLGARWLEDYAGWEAALLGPRDPLMQALGLRAQKRFDFDNGGVEVELWRLKLGPESVPRDQSPGALASRLIAQAETRPPEPAAEGFANRLRKNLRHRLRWARRQGISCFRVYDADLPEYNLAIDRYEDVEGVVWVNVQEYAPPNEIDPKTARTRLVDAMGLLPELLEVDPARVFLRIRQRQKGAAQYQPLDRKRHFVRVREGEAIVRVNFTDYLDTGLFLDHRQVRDRVAELSVGKRLLNLFCYTATASVRAACAGARSTRSVDLSATYLDWAADNFQENGFATDGRHALERADCREWLVQARRSGQASFDVIFLDPPSFSSSKRMDGVLDIQRDHVALIDDAMALLAPGGVLLFSTNLRRFRMEESLTQRYDCQDISLATLPEDFSRNQRIRQAFEFRHEES
ncbi:MAG: bifunctional 23S rRNA (guanine(2069)-N(7))-methyltransferase RlmK/23S rRNA (guanine(2445)-N(2))-methyltransferase RlmL [Halothiobacillaceae bacterium]